MTNITALNIHEDVFTYKPYQSTITRYYGDEQKQETTIYSYQPDLKYYYEWPCTQFYDRSPSKDMTVLSSFQLGNTETKYDDKLCIHRYLYAYDYVDTYNLKKKNMLYLPLGEEVMVGDVRISGKYTQFKDIKIDDQSHIVPYMSVSIQGEKEVSRITVEEFDRFLNHVYIKETGKPDVCYIWGYKGTYPVAKIVNATYALVKSAIGGENKIKEIGEASDVAKYLTLLNGLRESLPEAHITTYTYIPLVGITSITDPSGRVQTFHYDGACRPAALCDEAGNLIETYEYATKNE